MAIHAWRGEDTAPYLSCLTANDAKGRAPTVRRRGNGKGASVRSAPSTTGSIPAIMAIHAWRGEDTRALPVMFADWGGGRSFGS